jgi:hypothetical protein
MVQSLTEAALRMPTYVIRARSRTCPEAGAAAG